MDANQVQTRKMQQRSERKKRDAFRAFLASQREVGTIDARTRWTEFRKVAQVQSVSILDYDMYSRYAWTA
eukprot:SAG11_NODE_10711_length_810_cov_1.478200_1_plen_70_part_00